MGPGLSRKTVGILLTSGKDGNTGGVGMCIFIGGILDITGGQTMRIW